MSIISKFQENKSYTSRDINNLRKEVISIVREEVKNWSDFSDSDMGMVMLDVITGCIDYANYYLDKQANEVYLDRAQELKNVQAIAHTLGYKIPLVHSAEGQVVFALPHLFDDDLIVPKYTQVCTDTVSESGSLLYYATAKDTVIEAGKSFAFVPVIQGRVVELNPTIETLTESFKFYIDEKNIAEHSVVITDSEGEWEEVDDAYLEYNGGRKFSVHLDGDQVYILFTWDMADHFPITDETISIKYLISAGADGNIGAYLISHLVTSLYYNDRNLSDEMAVRNVDAITGGASAPSIYDIVVGAKNNFKSMGRYVTLQDYKEAVESEPSVFKAIVNDWNSENTFVPSPYMVIAKIISKDGATFEETYLNNFAERINSKGVCAVKFFAEQAEVKPFDINLQFTAISSDPLFRNSLVKKVKEALIDNFKYGRLEFGQTVTQADIRDVVLAQSSLIRDVEITYPNGPVMVNQDVYPCCGEVNVSIVGDYYGNNS